MVILFSFFLAHTEPGDDPEVVRAKYFIRDEFLVSIPQCSFFLSRSFILLPTTNCRLKPPPAEELYILYTLLLCLPNNMISLSQMTVTIEPTWRHMASWFECCTPACNAVVSIPTPSDTLCSLAQHFVSRCSDPLCRLKLVTLRPATDQCLSGEEGKKS